MTDAVAPIPDDLKDTYQFECGLSIDYGNTTQVKRLIERIAQAEQRAEKAETLCVEYSNRLDTADKVVAEKNEAIAKAEAERDALKQDKSHLLSVVAEYRERNDVFKAENTRLREALKTIKAYCHGEEEVNGFSEISDIARAALKPPKEPTDAKP